MISVISNSVIVSEKTLNLKLLKSHRSLDSIFYVVKSASFEYLIFSPKEHLLYAVSLSEVAEVQEMDLKLTNHYIRNSRSILDEWVQKENEASNRSKQES